MKFLVPNYSCLQKPWLGGYRPPDPRSLCPLSSTEFVEPPPSQNKIPGYSTGSCNCVLLLLMDLQSFHQVRKMYIYRVIILCDMFVSCWLAYRVNSPDRPECTGIAAGSNKWYFFLDKIVMLYYVVTFTHAEMPFLSLHTNSSNATCRLAVVSIILPSCG